jgi:hypothetical protein
MSLFDSIKQVVGTVQASVNGVNELKTKGQELASDYAQTLNGVVDEVQKSVPIDSHDQTIDKAQEKIEGLTGKPTE